MCHFEGGQGHIEPCRCHSVEGVYVSRISIEVSDNTFPILKHLLDNDSAVSSSPHSLCLRSMIRCFIEVQFYPKQGSQSSSASVTRYSKEWSWMTESIRQNSVQYHYCWKRHACNPSDCWTGGPNWCWTFCFRTWCIPQFLRPLPLWEPWILVWYDWQNSESHNW